MAPQYPLNHSEDAATDLGLGFAPSEAAPRRIATIGIWLIPLICIGATIGVWQIGGLRPIPLTISIIASIIVCALFGLVVRDLSLSDKALQRIRQHELWFRALIEGVDRYAIFMLDTNGCVASWNERAEQMKGYCASEIIGEHFSRFYLPDDIARNRPAIELDAARKYGMFEYEGWRVRKDGSRFWASVVLTAARSKSGEVVGFYKVTRDYTDRKRSQQLFQHVLEAAPDAMVIVNAEGRIIELNQQLLSLFGYTSEELIGQQVEVLVPERFIAKHPSFRNGFFEAPKVRPMGAGLELFGLKKDGLEVPIEVSLSPLEIKEGTVVCSAIRDITERKRAESDIRELNADLERRNNELAASNGELEAFTYSVAHDLRAPLRHIYGFSKILSEDFSSQLQPEAKEYLNDILQDTEKMGHLIDDLLSLARLSRQEVRVQVTGLNAIVSEVIQDLGSETRDRQIEWRVSQLPFVECDPGLMKQVFANLMSNSVKYTRPRAQAVIEIGRTPGENSNVVYVRDNGVGFSMKYADKLFGVFQRLHRSEDFEGTGVGLATVQRIIHKHNGNVWAEAELDKGAAFYFSVGAPVVEGTISGTGESKSGGED